MHSRINNIQANTVHMQSNSPSCKCALNTYTLTVIFRGFGLHATPIFKVKAFHIKRNAYKAASSTCAQSVSMKIIYEHENSLSMHAGAGFY